MNSPTLYTKGGVGGEPVSRLCHNTDLFPSKTSAILKLDFSSVGISALTSYFKHVLERISTAQYG